MIGASLLPTTILCCLIVISLQCISDYLQQCWYALLKKEKEKEEKKGGIRKENKHSGDRLAFGWSMFSWRPVDSGFMYHNAR